MNWASFYIGTIFGAVLMFLSLNILIREEKGV